MARFGHTSLSNLATCDERLQRIAHHAIKKYDFKVICGLRGEQAQWDAYNAGYSKLKYPKSKHNRAPSQAFDVVPYPIDWDNHDRFHNMAEVIKEEARREKVELIWGGDWQNFSDLAHFEIAQED